jgi:hypothetical protein
MSSFPRHGWPGGTDRYCCEKARLGISRGSLSRHWRTQGRLRSLCAKCRRIHRTVPFRRGRYGCLLYRTTVLPTMPIDSYSAIAVEYLLTSGDLDSLAGRMTENPYKAAIWRHRETLRLTSTPSSKTNNDSWTKACKDSKANFHRHRVRPNPLACCSSDLP